MVDTQSQQATDNQPLVEQIKALLAAITRKFDADGGEEWQWLASHTDNPALIDLLRDLTLTTLRVLDAIGQLEPVNGITVSKQFGIPKGSVSKSTRRLMTQKLVTAESLPNNKKEVLFRTTPLGQDLFRLHRAFDEQMERGFDRFLQRYSDPELQFLVRVLQEAGEASFLNLSAPYDTQFDYS